RTVLRRGGRGNSSPLFGKRTDKDLALQWNSIHWKDVRVHVNRLQTRIAKAVVRKESFPIAARLPGCEMLEPYDMKVSRTVLRRGGRGNSSPLFGKRTDKDLALQWNSIHWKVVKDTVNRLQTRIAKAVMEGSVTRGHMKDCINAILSVWDVPTTACETGNGIV
ncbi:MAG: reverse transcriptase N-terminal domain-containing protein, partial [Methanoregula sp.]